VSVWQSVEASLSDEEKAEWNQWREKLWHSFCDLQVALHRGFSEEDDVPDAARRLNEEIQGIPVFDEEDKGEKDEG